MRGGVPDGGKVGSRRRRATRDGRLASPATCVRCGDVVELETMVQWREGPHCLGCALEELELEVHGTDFERRRELCAIDADRAAADAEARRQDRAENTVRGW